jgi:hypothetical protein
MKKIVGIVVCSLFLSTGFAQKATTQTLQLDTTKKMQIVDAACGQCQFGLKAKVKGCDLAVRYNDTAYFVDGTNIDSHGDAHAKDGFCEAVRKAEVQGELVNNRFVVTYFKLVPAPTSPVKAAAPVKKGGTSN